MKKIIGIFILLLVNAQMAYLLAMDADSEWKAISIGNYKGYAEMYTKQKMRFVMVGDLGDETSLKVTEKGVVWDGAFFAWDAPGRQASRHTENSKAYQRIYVRGRCGPVIIVDFYNERPQGKVEDLIRMVVAPVPDNK